VSGLCKCAKGGWGYGENVWVGKVVVVGVFYPGGQGEMGGGGDSGDKGGEFGVVWGKGVRAIIGWGCVVKGGGGWGGGEGVGGGGGGNVEGGGGGGGGTTSCLAGTSSNIKSIKGVR